MRRVLKTLGSSISPRLVSRVVSSSKEIRLLGPAETILTDASAPPTEISTTPVSYCVIVDLRSDDKRFLHHFTGIDVMGNRIEKNIESFKDDLKDFITECEKVPTEIDLIRMMGYEDVSGMHLSDKSIINFYKRDNLRILENSLEEVAKELGIKDLRTNHEIKLGEFTTGISLSGLDRKERTSNKIKLR